MEISCRLMKGFDFKIPEQLREIPLLLITKNNTKMLISL